MTPLLLALSIFGAMLLLMALRVPIAVAMFAAGVLGYVLKAGWLPLAMHLNTHAFARFASYDLSVIPLFILMGNFATQGGISRALFEFAAALMGRMRGGLAMASVVASGAFGAICGSSVATAATITQVALPEMRRHGYSGRLATGTLAAGGTLGILIPPSVPLVVYAVLAEQNIAKLFAAAMVPGLIAVLGYLLAIAAYVRIAPGHAPAHDDTAAPRLHARMVWGVLPIVVIFAIVFGGIYTGKFTPTEGAAVGAAATFVAALLGGELTWGKLKQCCYATAQASAMIFMIFLGADLMNAALALSQVPAQLAQWAAGLSWPPMALLGAILLFYIVSGFFMDELSVMLLTIPLVFPMMMALDFGMPKESVAIWFGILVLMTVGFGLLSPPVGLNVYVVNGMARDVPIAESYRGVMPFLLADAVRLLLLLAFPVLALWVLRLFN
ncbi:MAG TPA: TRAP transporter large permease [Rubrivivax sp.]|nr:TRAP transporter large permease [Rubrivivax sp.]